MKIWQRYLFGHLTRAFLLFTTCLFGLYIAVDFSMHGAKFLSKETTCLLDIGANYLLHFVKFAPLFFSLSFLLAMLRVLLDLGAHRETVALQIAGLSSKKLLSPFVFFAILLTLAIYANFQWISPDAQGAADTFYKSHSTHAEQLEKVFSLVLSDGSELVYQRYDPSKKELFDVFWIRSFEEIWHMKTLEVEPHPPQGRFVDRFLRSGAEGTEKTDSFESRPFPELLLDIGASFQRFIPFENRSLSVLWRGAITKSSDRHRSAAHLHYKLAAPLVIFLMIAAVGPVSLRYSRTRSPLLFIACSLFAFLGLMTLLDAILILAENQALPAALAIWGPLVAAVPLSSAIGYLRNSLK